MVIGKPTDTDPQLEFLVPLPSRNDLETLALSISPVVVCKPFRISQSSGVIPSERVSKSVVANPCVCPSSSCASKLLQLNAVRKSASGPLRAGGGTTQKRVQRDQTAQAMVLHTLTKSSPNPTFGNLTGCLLCGDVWWLISLILIHRQVAEASASVKILQMILTSW